MLISYNPMARFLLVFPPSRQKSLELNSKFGPFAPAIWDVPINNNIPVKRLINFG
jgi:hypothetical protein